MLLVEDNFGDVGLIRILLDQQTIYRVTLVYCETLADARRTIDTNQVDVVLLDLGLPDSDGLTTIKELSSTMPQMPIVAITGSSDPTLAESAISSGAEDYLVKGEFDEDRLMKALIGAIRKKQIISRAAYEAQYDRLTGLANRLQFLNRLQRTIDVTMRQQTCFAVLYVDIDGFKKINTELGDIVGDALLKSCGERLVDGLPPDCLVARVGSDEFAILAPQSKDGSQVPTLCHAVGELFETPLNTRTRSVDVRVTLGAAIFGVDGTTSDDLLKNADLALRRARKEEVSFHLSDPELRTRFMRRKALSEDLQEALDQGEITVAYQPIVDLKTMKISGAEALARWNNKRLGAIAPPEFIGIAEDSGLIYKLGMQVLKRAVTEAQKWQSDLKSRATIAVNCSAHQLQSDRLVGDVLEIVSEAGLEPSALELEITETAMFETRNLPLVIENLVTLRAAGIVISVDDFGTGYSSLSYLQRFPCDKIKVDREFVGQIEASTTAKEISRAIIALGHSLDKKIVAEGIETQEQLDFLSELDCPYGQGYLLFKPMPLPDFVALLGEAA